MSGRCEGRGDVPRTPTCCTVENCPRVRRAGELTLPLMSVAALRIVDHAPHLRRTVELTLMVGAQMSLSQGHDQGILAIPLLLCHDNIWARVLWAGIPMSLCEEAGRAHPRAMRVAELDMSLTGCSTQESRLCTLAGQRESAGESQ